MVSLETCYRFGLNPNSITLKPVPVESRKILGNPEHVNNNVIAYSQFETSVGKPVSNSDLREKKNPTDSYEVFFTGQILTDNGFQSGNDKIKIYSPSLGKKYITKSDATGYFQLDKVLAADDYQLQVFPQGMYQKYYEEISILPPFTNFYIQLESVSVNTLHGLILNIDWIPVTNFKLKVRSSGKSKWEKKISTDSIGRFELENVPVGDLHFTSMLDQVLSIEGYKLQSNQHQSLTLIVDEGSYAISGLVIDRNGEPAVGANVILSWKNVDSGKRTTVSRRTTTVLNGSFYLQGVGPGPHTLVVADLSSGAAFRETLNISSDYTDIVIYLN